MSTVKGLSDSCQSEKLNVKWKAKSIRTKERMWATQIIARSDEDFSFKGAVAYRNHFAIQAVTQR